MLKFTNSELNNLRDENQHREIPRAGLGAYFPGFGWYPPYAHSFSPYYPYPFPSYSYPFSPYHPYPFPPYPYPYSFSPPPTIIFVQTPPPSVPKERLIETLPPPKVQLTASPLPPPLEEQLIELPLPPPPPPPKERLISTPSKLEEQVISPRPPRPVSHLLSTPSSLPPSSEQKNRPQSVGLKSSALVGELKQKFESLQVGQGSQTKQNIEPDFKQRMASSLPPPMSNTKSQQVFYRNMASTEFDLTQAKLLGKGTYGEVYKVLWKKTPVAIKKFNFSNDDNQERVQSFEREANIMGKFPHPHIVQIFGACNEPGNCFIVMEYMEKGSLKDLLHSQQWLGWPRRQQFALDIAKGLAFLHSSGILHQDLKSGNVLLDGNFRARIGDLGLARATNKSQSFYKYNNTKGALGTLPWMGPELYIPGAKCTEKSDIYSYGIVVWEIACRIEPYKEATNPDMLERWVKSGYRERDKIPTNTPAKIKNLIEVCWHNEAAERPTADQVIGELEKESPSSFNKNISNNNNNQLKPQSGGYIGNQYRSLKK